MNNQKTNWKYLLIVIILATITGGGILAYQYWWVPKQKTKLPEITIKNETAGWQTYRNEEYGFEFKYPKEWYLNFEIPNVEISSAPKSEYAHGVGKPNYEDVVLEIIKRNQKGIDGESSYMEYKNTEITELKKFLEHNGLIYEMNFSFGKNAVQAKEYRVIFDQILSTSKFID